MAYATDDAALFRKLTKQFRGDREHSAKWRKEAKEDFDFVAGEQWSEEDKAYLRQQMRPVITMNRTATVINAVSGQEISNRLEVRYIPREQGDVQANEILTEAARWFRDNANADDEDSEAFLNATICGMGWTDATLDFEEDEAGEPIMPSIDPLKMWWDKNSVKHNLVDRQRQWYAEAMPLSRAMEMFPDADVTDLDAKWASEDPDEGELRDQDRDKLYQGDGEDGDEVDGEKTVTIIHCQYIEKVPAYRVVSPLDGSETTLSAEDYRVYRKRAKEMGLPVHSTQVKRKKIMDCWLGSKILDRGEALVQERFRYQCITAYRDHNKGTFYGLVRSMKDPQRWANKWLSQSLDLMNSQAKGGVFIEEGALGGSARDFEKTYARADKPTVLPNGSLSNPDGPRVVPKPQGQFPAGFFQLMEFSIASIRDVVGVSVEMMGMADRDQPASLEFQRRQSGMIILQPILKNLRRYKHEQGRVLLDLIQNHLSDGRLVRIVGQDFEQYVPLVRQADVKYDIIIDDAPTSPNQKEMIWSMIGDKFWELPPDIQMALLEYSPFPSTVVEKVKKASEEQSQGEMAQLQQRMAMLEAQLKEAQVGKTQAETAKIASEVGANDPRIKQAETQAKIQGDQIKAQADIQTSQQKAAADIAIAREKQASDMALKEREMAFDQAMRAEDAAVDRDLRQQSAEADMALRAKMARQQGQRPQAR